MAGKRARSEHVTVRAQASLRPRSLADSGSWPGAGLKTEIMMARRRSARMPDHCRSETLELERAEMPGGLAVKLGYCDAGLRLKLPRRTEADHDGCGTGLKLTLNLTPSLKTEGAVRGSRC